MLDKCSHSSFMHALFTVLWCLCSSAGSSAGLGVVETLGLVLGGWYRGGLIVVKDYF